MRNTQFYVRATDNNNNNNDNKWTLNVIIMNFVLFILFRTTIIICIRSLKSFQSSQIPH